jgi:hypothetical protein
MGDYHRSVGGGFLSHGDDGTSMGKAKGEHKEDKQGSNPNSSSIFPHFMSILCILDPNLGNYPELTTSLKKIANTSS